MRALAVLCLLAGTVSAEPLPPGSIGVMFGGVAGTGAYASRLGLGYYQLGGQGAWQPMSTEQRVGWSLKWSFNFGRTYDASAARIDDVLRTIQFDLMAGVRIRPGTNPSRYVTLRAGGELFRSSQPIPPSQTQRSFAGGVASIGLDQYGWCLVQDKCLYNIDVRYGLIGDHGPQEIALIVGLSLVGP
ncbi:MAG TPA: hypothetical protein VGM88_22380 [Kofleriaceae bacterium]|jgi:hypothetical protein